LGVRVPPSAPRSQPSPPPGEAFTVAKAVANGSISGSENPVDRVGGVLAELRQHVAGIITDDHGRALLIQRADNRRWGPPGGVLELGGTIHDGLRREIREETGLDIEPVTLTGVYKNMPRGIIALVFRCKITGGTWPGTLDAALALGRRSQPPS
jgi:ADP-ribose pyrophosphatase YjhB (NUDIX family)